MCSQTQKKLHIAVVLDTEVPRVWQEKILNEINTGNYGCLKLVIIANSEIEDEPRLYSMYRKMEKNRWVDNNNLFSLENNNVIHDLDVIDLSLNAPEERIKLLESYELDVILNLTQTEIPENISACASAGVWSWHYGDGVNIHHQSPVGFWEIYSGSPTMGAMLVSYHSKAQVLHHSVFASSDRSSAYLNHKQACQITMDKTPEILERLFNLGEKKFFEFQTQSQQQDSNKSNYQSRQGFPDNLQMLGFFSKKLLNSVKMRFMNSLFSEEWTMRYKLGQGMSKEFQSFKKLAPAQGGLWADPFIIYEQGRYYLFFEDAVVDKENADISVITIDEDGSMSEPRRCLEKPYHLSYPHVFLWEGDYYMMPETKGNRTIEIYKATNFPDQWEFHSNLMKDIEAVDTSLYFQDEKWWLFTSIKPQKGVSINNELSVFFADSPLSQNWTPHPLNPVITDVRLARPAGRVYMQDNKVMRPSQDASVRYGYGFRINEIVTLTETEYKEREIEFIEPTWATLLTGTHTFAHEKDLTVIDVLEWRPRFLK